MQMHSFILSLLVSSAVILGAQAHPRNSSAFVRRQTAGKLVFAHFMVHIIFPSNIPAETNAPNEIGVVSDRTSAAAYDSDMQRAKSIGIDAFALNIGVDSYTDQQLGYAYQSAANNGMKVFISFDFNWWNTGEGSAVGAKIAQYAGRPAQLFVDGKVFASSFAGDGLDVAAVRAAVGRAVYFAPNYHPDQGDFSSIDAALNWMGWSNNGNNKAPSGGVTVSVTSGDQAYRSALGSKGYVAPASPWFSTHFGPEVSYSKNWVFPSDLLWYLRWREILSLQPNFVEIVTWNDYGESHYVGPLSSPHTDDGSSRWVNDMPHDGWLEMAKPFIQAYKAGSTNVNQYITNTTMQPANNPSGNYFEGRPNGYQTMTDDVFVVTLLRAAGTVVVNSGGTAYTYSAPAGASAFAVPFHLATDTEHLPLRVNFNAYVGTVPPGPRDVLQSDGLSNFARGLKVACAATPSLPATPPAATPATTTIAATVAPTAPPI
ncbi:putative alpha-1,3-glucanase/mutanase [Mycena sanguinolenta]|uniref:Putative alpha-1,3-glucanase/mutanase n=1 Tax=Mycena sanguinolenta TaxID=230812 RepID=A0A8H6YTD3_9AGAR|nr:putative alpha-1,3-glucanase/mutanase [Mycena sanguinolenta]